MTRATNDSVHQWIEEAGAAMGGDTSARREALLELESSIYDQIDEQTDAGVAEQTAVTTVLGSFGDAATISSSLRLNAYPPPSTTVVESPSIVEERSTRTTLAVTSSGSPAPSVTRIRLATSGCSVRRAWLRNSSRRSTYDDPNNDRVPGAI